MRAKYNRGGGTALDQFMAKYQNGGVNNTQGDPVNYNTESDRQKSDQGLISYQDPKKRQYVRGSTDDLMSIAAQALLNSDIDMNTNDPMLAREMSVGVMQNAIEEYLNGFGEEDVIGGAGGSQMTQAKKDKLQELIIPQIQAHAARFANQARQ